MMAKTFVECQGMHGKQKERKWRGKLAIKWSTVRKKRRNNNNNYYGENFRWNCTLQFSLLNLSTMEAFVFHHYLLVSLFFFFKS